MKHMGKTPPFDGPKGEILPGSMAEVGYLRLGGLDEWVMDPWQELRQSAL